MAKQKKIDEQKENALFLLMAQLDLATSSFTKWCSMAAFDQVSIAFKHYREFYDRDNVQHEKTDHPTRPA